MKWARWAKPKRTTLLAVGLASFLVGIALARAKIDPLSIFILVPAIFVLRKLKFGMLIIVILGIYLGWWRGSIYLRKIEKYKPLYFQSVSVIGTVDIDGIYDKGSQLAFDIGNLEVVKPYKTKLVGKLGIKGFGTPMVYRSDVVEITGKLYPTRGSKQASISYAKIELLKHQSTTLESVRRRFITGMYNALPEPLASFGLGLLIGQRNTLPEEISNQLSAVGLTHVVAVSGYNLTIIMTSVAFGLRNRSKYQATLNSALLIGLFLLFTGFSASIVRAAIVSSLSLITAFYGRSFKPVLLILLAAALTAGFYPIYIWSDVGWYLSFLAFFGVLVIAPLTLKRLYKKREPKMLALVVAETIAAQIMALPIIMFIFGEVSLISLPANVLVVPLVPLAMLLSFVAALGGMLVPAIIGWLAWPAKIILTYMLDTISLLSKFPNALVTKSLTVSQLIIIYSLILALLLILMLKTRRNTPVTDILSKE